MFRLTKLGIFFLLLTSISVAFAGDPTRPAYLQDSRPAPVVIKPAPLAPLTVNAIFYSPERKLVIINNRILRVGDIIEGALIKDIASSSVTIQRSGSLSRLSLSGVVNVKQNSTYSETQSSQPQELEKAP